MKQNTRLGMCSFSCVCKLSTFQTFKVYTILYQFFNDLARASNHNINRLFTILIMSCLHCIFKVTVIVILIMEYTNSSLCQKRITTLQICLCDHNYFFISWQIQRTEQSCNSCSYDYNICIYSHHETSF